MSAAEKLEALGTLTLENEHGVPIRSHTVAEQLVDVLPQIVAVVEAAERYGLAQEVHVWGKEGEYAFPDLASALAALEEALS